MSTRTERWEHFNELPKDELVFILMETKYRDDSPQYFQSTVDWLRTLEVKDLANMLDQWENS